MRKKRDLPGQLRMFEPVTGPVRKRIGVVADFLSAVVSELDDCALCAAESGDEELSEHIGWLRDSVEVVVDELGGARD
ncbi:MAG: hypothetical protein JSS27_18895 [Planctomycetes bacterium]|nr:hypothetical protein [Planctomycetota bacterium]